MKRPRACSNFCLARLRARLQNCLAILPFLASKPFVTRFLRPYG